MPRLIHLNGLPGSGKSTLGRAWVEAHDGSLLVDPDLLLTSIGGWRERFFALIPTARALAVSLVSTHLTGSSDVVLCQLATAPGEIEPYERAARDHGADVVEVLLTCDPELLLARRSARAGDTAHGIRHDLDAVIEEHGGEQLLRRIQSHFQAYASLRDQAHRLLVRDEPVAETLRRLEELLDPGCPKTG
ncbi:AAA family ATPase [Nocardioides euryhalodurans]|uniref:Uncharacterized protein n=1 Tax=Nocardioides euryhalodurans TaxID=2518370 RepID=A0A4P7GGX0_9ACTN|nr:AAA family ATPase [Nocardioides euryhalodurans]QBR90974.1 hypothetical protein EXE57_00830 [Nocardioides euryhalodurans]